jgi:hypothetical protein
MSEALDTLLIMIWIGIGLVNVLIIGHAYASEEPRARDGGEAFFKSLIAIIAAPWFLVFFVGFKVKKFPKIKISVTKEN